LLSYNLSLESKIISSRNQLVEEEEQRKMLEKGHHQKPGIHDKDFIIERREYEKF